MQVCVLRVIIDKTCAWESPSRKKSLVHKSNPGGFPGEVTQSSCQLEGGREGGAEGVVQLRWIYT